jgi:hypothetical protein
MRHLTIGINLLRNLFFLLHTGDLQDKGFGAGFQGIVLGMGQGCSEEPFSARVYESEHRNHFWHW